MHKTPLFATHLAHGADMETLGGWMMPATYGSDRDAAVAAEVARARAGVGLVDLASTALLTVQGEELQRWLNGMFTNKYAEMEPGQGARSVIVDDRGRVQGLVDWYCLDPQRFLGVLEGVDAAWFEERFRMFMMLDDIECEAVAEQSLLHLCGPGVDGVLAALGLPRPQADHGHAAVGEGLRVMRKDRTGLGGVDLVVPREVLDTTFAALRAAGASPMGHLALDALRILAGRAAWPQDGTEKSMVHELRYNLDCVHFQKGCYLGQEVINRVERVGGVKKKLTRLKLAQDAVPPLGAEVLLGEELVGSLSSVARIGQEVWALGTLREAAWTEGTSVQVRAGDRQVAATVHPV